MNQHNKSVTLLELLIAIALLSVIAIGFSSIDLFSRYHVISSDRRAKLQNEISYVLEHMTKEISKAVGDVSHRPIVPSPSSDIIIAWIDVNQNGRQDPYPTDHCVMYWYQDNPTYQILYYPNTGSSSAYEIIARKINSCSFQHAWTAAQRNNYVDITIAACWDPDGVPNACGTPDNPSVTMRTQIKMPAVSTN